MGGPVVDGGPVGGDSVGRQLTESGTTDAGTFEAPIGTLLRPGVIDPFSEPTDAWVAFITTVPGQYTFEISGYGDYYFTASEAFYDYLAGTAGDSRIGNNGIPGGPVYSVTESFTVTYNPRVDGSGTTTDGGTHVVRMDIVGRRDPGQPCFVRGTSIMTPKGPVAIEQLKAGDLVVTKDNSVQPICWIGSATAKAKGSRGLRRRAPIRIQAGALGAGIPQTDILVSPQHRMLIGNALTKLMFEQSEVLVPARHLVNGSTITVASDILEVEYFHMLFDTHQIVYAEGCPSESFHPGHQGVDAFAKETRAEILSLFPQLAIDEATYGPATRYSLKRYEGEALARRMFGPLPNTVKARAAHALRTETAA